jgi:DNA primase
MTNSAVEQIKDRLDIVDVVGGHVQLKKAGRSFKGLCPFHQEKTPSFTVFPETQTFHCFGCGAGGDLINFVMQQERVDFREALQTLARQAGVELSEAPERERVDPDRFAHLYDLNQRATSWFAHVLWRTAHGEPGRKLLERRGVDQATAERFQLGFAPDRWDALLKRFEKHDVPIEHSIDAGLASQNEQGRVYDRFRNRLMFPIRDADGRVIGFGARALGDEMPKYLNSPQTAIFDKSASLYGLDLASAAMREKREVIVVEGYMDAIAAHQFDYKHVVASMGTALTEGQVRLVRQGVDRIVLALDADVAGQMATIRGLDVMRESLSETGRAVIDGPGIVRFERTLRTDIRIAELPPDTDPDDLIRNEPERWRAIIADPVPFLDFYVRASIGDPPPSDPKEKSNVVQRLAPVLREIGDPVVREHYVGLAAGMLGVSERVLLTAMPSRSRRLAPVGRGRPVGVSPEEHLFGLLLRYPEFLLGLAAEVPEGDVVDARRREILLALTSAPVEDPSATVEGFPDELGEHARDLTELLGERPQTFPGQLRREAEQALRRLRKQRHDERMRQLMADVSEAERGQDRESLRHNMLLLEQLRARYPEFYPSPSPYFRDIRDAGD